MGTALRSHETPTWVEEPQQGPRAPLRRRSILAGAAAAVLPLSPFGAPALAEAEVEVLSDVEGFGQKVATPGNLVLVAYRALVQESGRVFDTTYGGMPVRTNGVQFTIEDAPLVPRILLLRPDPVPGVPAGLKQGVLGMRVGGKRKFAVPPELGFGNQPVLAPFGDVPASSTLIYEVELLRLSSTGPDELMKGVSQCGLGGAGAQFDGCADIVPLE